MQKYRPKTLLASTMDHLLRALLAASAGIMWFVMLWGLSMASVAAGVALGGLMWLCVRQFCKQSTQRREKQMRRLIGGELALNELLLLPDDQAAERIEKWLSPILILQNVKRVGFALTGDANHKRVMVWPCIQHESQLLSAQQVVEAARLCAAEACGLCIIASTAPITREASAFASSCSSPIHILSRKEMIELAGATSPATDEQLRQLGKDKKRPLKEWTDVILSPVRLKRYLLYGIGLGILGLLTGRMAYVFPAFSCMVLFAAGKWRSRSARAGHFT